MPRYRVTCMISDVVEAESKDEAFDKSFQAKALSAYPMDDFEVEEIES